MEAVGVEPNYLLQQIWNTLRLQYPLLGPDSDPDEWDAAFQMLGVEDRQAIGFSRPGVLSNLAKMAIQRIQGTEVTDFVDHLWAPLHVGGIDDISVPYLILDEANDASPATVELIRRTAKGKVLTIGDRFQTIFEFAGAYLGNMDDITDAHSAAELQLTNCWRCPREVVEFTQNSFVPHIATTNSAGGSVGTSPEVTLEDVENANLVVSARYSSLLPHLFAALTSGVPCYVEGRDFVSGVLKEFNNKPKAMKTRNMPDQDWFEDRYNFFTACARKLRPTVGNAARIQSLLDKAASFQVFSESEHTMPELARLLRASLEGKDTDRSVRFSSIHKAKGLEADSVVVVNSTATEGWENCVPGDLSNESLRLMYVACTRAKQSLVVQTTQR
jgi:hypothetical protein